MMGMKRPSREGAGLLKGRVSICRHMLSSSYHRLLSETLPYSAMPAYHVRLAPKDDPFFKWNKC